VTDPSWHTDDHPELRAGPPWVMADMVALEPELAEQMLSDPSPVAGAIAALAQAALAQDAPVTVTGCGTSEHAAHAVAALIADAVGAQRRGLVRGRPAFSAAGDQLGGLCLAVSHEGGTRATELACAAARQAGARTALITQQPAGRVAAVCDEVLVTPRRDASWCHTVGYTSPILAGAAIAAALGGPVPPPAAACDLLRETTQVEAGRAGARLADRRVVLCAGAGVDHLTARELALKLAEGARLPTVALELETVLHGQLAGHEPSDGLVLVAIDEAGSAELVARRAAHVAGAAAAIGMPVLGLLSRRFDAALAADLTPAGRLVVDAPGDRPSALLAGAGLLQALTLAVVHARGTNPDLIRREVDAYRAAANVAERDDAW
jgi:fructoselysine-6-P-deglycase FrlB-like protein